MFCQPESVSTQNRILVRTFCLIIKQITRKWSLKSINTWTDVSAGNTFSYLPHKNTLSAHVPCVCVSWSLNMVSPSSPGSLPLKRRMDDEEEDMSRPISQLWGTPFRDIKYEDQATQMAGQALAVAPTSQSHNNNSIGSIRPSCGLHWQPHVPFQGKEGGGRKPTVCKCLTLIAASHN